MKKIHWFNLCGHVPLCLIAAGVLSRETIRLYADTSKPNDSRPSDGEKE